MQAYYRVLELPWSLSAEDERKFRQLLLRIAGAILVFSIVIPFLPVPKKDLDAVTEVPPRYAKLVLEKKAPPPPPPKPEPIEELEPEPLPEPEKVVEKEPEPEPEPEKAPEPDPTELARENAKKAGVLAFADDLADLRELDSVASVTDNRDLVGAAAEAGRSERNLITSSAGKSSGGINTAGLSRDTGGSGGLAARETTKVTSAISEAARAKKRKERETGVSSRSREEIEMIFDRNKGAIFALYNRALRRNPTLQGKLVLKLTIAPSGKVTDCEVVSSELEDPDLERKLVQRVKLFNFGAKNVAVMTTTKPIDFFPA